MPRGQMSGSVKRRNSSSVQPLFTLLTSIRWIGGKHLKEVLLLLLTMTWLLRGGGYSNKVSSFSNSNYILLVFSQEYVERSPEQEYLLYYIIYSVVVSIRRSIITGSANLSTSSILLITWIIAADRQSRHYTMQCSSQGIKYSYW